MGKGEYEETGNKGIQGKREYGRKGNMGKRGVKKDLKIKILPIEAAIFIYSPGAAGDARKESPSERNAYYKKEKQN